jgi:hypothetical protein
MTALTRTAFLLTASLAFASCKDDDSSTTPPINQPPPTPQEALSAIDTTGSPDGIVDLPTTVPAVVTDVFARYSQVTTANGRRIHFLAQSGVADTLHFRARRVLEQHLTDVALSTHGASKAALRDELSAAQATFVIFRDAASADPAAAGVPAFLTAFPGYGQLVATDSILEGTLEYMAASPALDTTLSSTARFVLSASGASLAAFRSDLATRAADAQAAAIYVPAPGTQDATGDFLARTIEVYYGIWGHDPLGNGRAGVDDLYSFSDRLAMAASDPATLSLIESFFAPIHTYPAYLPDGFSGTFATAFDVATPYTHRSRYLARVGLRGAVGARIEGNELDGLYQGSTGDDEFVGGEGDDLIEGGSTADLDRALYSGASTEYLIIPSPFGGGATQVLDTVPNRDGVDQVRFVEQLVFSDMTIIL